MSVCTCVRGRVGMDLLCPALLLLVLCRSCVALVKKAQSGSNGHRGLMGGRMSIKASNETRVDFSSRQMPQTMLNVTL